MQAPLFAQLVRQSLTLPWLPEVAGIYPRESSVLHVLPVARRVNKVAGSAVVVKTVVVTGAAVVNEVKFW